MTEDNLLRLGKFLRDAQDRIAPTREEQAVGARQLREVQSCSASSSRRWTTSKRWSLAVALAACVVLIAVNWVRRDPGPITLRASQVSSVTLPAKAGTAQSSEVPVGSWIASQASERLLSFSDGSRITLAPESQMRVERLDARGAGVILERGQAQVSVQHAPTAHWSFSAGPFAVTVVGTQFSLGWDPTEQHLTLAMREGIVTLAGPVVGASRRVQRGEALEIFVREGRLEARDGKPNVDEGAAGEKLGTVPTSDLGQVGISAQNGPRSGNPASPRPETTHAALLAKSTVATQPWAALARSGRFAEALAAAEEAGFDAICRSSSADELRVLGDTARLAGNSARAKQAFTSIRSRFAHSGYSATAAFLLGKLSFDHTKHFAESVNWFRTCLQEQPSGPFAREAAGRLIEALRLSGNDQDARSAATQYLSRYPDGPHADLARSLLKR